MSVGMSSRSSVARTPWSAASLARPWFGTRTSKARP